MSQVFESAVPARNALAADRPMADRGAFNREHLRAFPELAAIFDRYLSQSAWIKSENGFVLVAPTMFHAQGLRKFQPLIENYLGGSITAIESSREQAEALAPATPRARPVQNQNPGSPTALPTLGSGPVAQSQPRLPLPPRNAAASENPLEVEGRKRFPAPFFQSSPAFEVPLQMLKNWVEALQGGNGSRVMWIHGKAGAGKSTLLKQCVRWVPLAKRLVYTDVMAFLNEWRQAMDAGDTFTFTRKYRRETDVLVIENLDELQNKIKTQEELRHTINALLERGAAIAVSSTQHPSLLKEVLDPSLFSRLFSGLVLEMPAPDRPFKEFLWRHMLENHGMAERPFDLIVQERLINLPVDSVRKVHTLFINAVSRLSLKGSLDLDDLGKLEALYAAPSVCAPGAAQKPLELIEKMARLCGVGMSAIQGDSRSAPVALARRFVCLGLSRFLGLTNSSIATYLEKNPSTISYALKSIEEEIAANRHVQSQWNWLCAQLGADPGLRQ